MEGRGLSRGDILAASDIAGPPAITGGLRAVEARPFALGNPDF